MSDLKNLVLLLRQKQRLVSGSVTKSLGNGRYRVRVGNNRTSVISGIDRDIPPGSRVTIARSDDGRMTIIAAAKVTAHDVVDVVIDG